MIADHHMGEKINRISPEVYDYLDDIVSSLVEDELAGMIERHHNDFKTLMVRRYDKET